MSVPLPLKDQDEQDSSPSSTGARQDSNQTPQLSGRQPSPAETRASLARKRARGPLRPTRKHSNSAPTSSSLTHRSIKSPLIETALQLQKNKTALSLAGKQTNTQLSLGDESLRGTLSENKLSSSSARTSLPEIKLSVTSAKTHLSTEESKNSATPTASVKPAIGRPSPSTSKEILSMKTDSTQIIARTKPPAEPPKKVPPSRGEDGVLPEQTSKLQTNDANKDSFVDTAKETCSAESVKGSSALDQSRSSMLSNTFKRRLGEISRNGSARVTPASCVSSRASSADSIRPSSTDSSNSPMKTSASEPALPGRPRERLPLDSKRTRFWRWLLPNWRPESIVQDVVIPAAIYAASYITAEIIMVIVNVLDPGAHSPDVEASGNAGQKLTEVARAEPVRNPDTFSDRLEFTNPGIHNSGFS